MPRVIPFPSPEEQMLEEFFGEVTHVTDGPKELHDPVPDLLAFARQIIRYREAHGLTPYRYLVVACPKCPEVMLVRAGTRGGSWRGRCYTCGTKAERGTTEVIEEAT